MKESLDELWEKSLDSAVTINPYEPPLQKNAKNTTQQRRSSLFAILGAFAVVAVILLFLIAIYAWLCMYEITKGWNAIGESLD